MPPRGRLRLRDPRPSTQRRAFTLIQLLVVLGIIVTLIGLALPAIVKSYRYGLRTRTLADLQLISTALEAYRQDFGDYPRIDNDNTANGLNQQKDRGARLLCRALIGPGPATDRSGGSIIFGWDGADGAGFRVRPGTGGKTWGPYVQTDKFSLGGSDNDPKTGNFSDAVILDRENNPILYYVANTTASASAAPANAQFILSQAPPPPGNPTAYTIRPMYNSYDNEKYLPLAELRYILGDRTPTGGDGTIGTGETAVTTAPYLLWTAGPDGIFGRSPTGKTDDIANFEFPGDIRK